MARVTPQNGTHSNASGADTEQAPRTASERRDGAARKRVPFGAPRTKLEVDVQGLRDEGYHVHWFNDVDSRLLDADAGFYEHVRYAEIGLQRGRESAAQGDDRVCKRVGVNPDGTPLMAYLMKIREEYFLEDEESKAERDRAIMEDMRRAAHSGARPDDRQVDAAVKLTTEVR